MTAAVCPYCRTNIGGEDRPVVCEGCGTAHHADCYTKMEAARFLDAAGLLETSRRLASQLLNWWRQRSRNARGASLPASSPARRCSAAHNDERTATHGESSCAFDVRRLRRSGYLRHLLKKRWSTNRNARRHLAGSAAGGFGAHNFYAGYYKKAGIQLGITVNLGFGTPISWMWAVIDICTINRDVQGVQFES